MIAAISGMVLVEAIITIVVVGIVFWLLWWLIGYCGIPEPFNKVARVFLAIAAVLFLINLLLSLVGMPIITWP